MHIKTIASAAILTAAMGFSGLAYAQTMIGNQSVSEADMERVKVYCEDLKTASTQAVGTDTSSDDQTEPTNDTVAENSQSEVGSLDIDQITLENCIAAGIVQATP